MRALLKGKIAQGWVVTAALITGLYLLNFYICRELFGIEYLRFMGSIEGGFIGLARFAMAHWNDLTWFPLWADGVPYQTTYPPLLPLLVAGHAWFHHISPAHAYHWVTAFFYCLGPVALFALTLRLSKSRWAAFAAGLIYSSVSMSAWLVPVVAKDLGSLFYPRRLQALVLYGEGPHVSSMTMLTLALFLLDVAMTRRRAPYTFLAAAAFAATAVTNWLGAFAIPLMVIPYILANVWSKTGQASWGWRDLARLGWISLAAYGLAMPLMPPSTIAVLAQNAKTTGGDYTHAYATALPEMLAVLAALGAIKFAVRRWVPGLQFAVLFSFVMTLLTLGDFWFGIAMVPMSFRYHLEMEMALAVLVALGGLALLRDRPRWLGGLAVSLLIAAMIQPIRLERRYARNFLLQSVDIQKTIEWRKAQWLNQHWADKQRASGNGDPARILMTGSSAFWLAAFSDIPQLWGFDQGTTDYTIRGAEFAIYSSDSVGPNTAANSVLWLKALGAQAVSVSGPASEEVYQNFSHPNVFGGVLDPIWREGDNVIYQVGSERTSLARVVPAAALVIREPIHGLDTDPIRPYVAALDDPSMPKAQFRWTSMHSADIATNLEPGQVVSLQMAWANGWHATVNGKPAPVRRDAIGLMYVDPAHVDPDPVERGPARIQIYYDGGTERLVARSVFVVTAVILVIASLLSVLRSREQ